MGNKKHIRSTNNYHLHEVEDDFIPEEVITTFDVTDNEGCLRAYSPSQSAAEDMMDDLENED